MWKDVAMALRDDEIKQLIIDMLSKPSERDGQRLVGASEIGNPCDYCLACRLLGYERKENKWWLGARLGTAIHADLQELAETIPAKGRFRALEGALIETKITVGEIDGYGVIKSKPDLVLTGHNHLLDYKTSSKLKVSKYKLDGLPQQYIIQQNLYAWGLNKSGITIDKCSLIFINREGSTDNDFWVATFDYDEEVAVKAWSRLQSMWNWLRSNDVNDLKSDADCFYCNNIIGRW